MKREALNHTKMHRLARRLGIALWGARGIMESIWKVTEREAPRGDIGKLSDEDIAISIDWTGDPSELVTALKDSGWIDTHHIYRYTVHDWSEHADDGVHSRLARAGELFADGKSPKTSKLSTADRPAAEKRIKAAQRRRAAECGARLQPEAAAGCNAVPNLTSPDHTEPNQNLAAPTPSAPAPRRAATTPVNWSREACDDWIAQFGGTAPGGRIGKAVKPLVAKYGWPAVRGAWLYYLRQAEAEYASAQRFAATYGRWASTAGPAVGNPTGEEELPREAAERRAREEAEISREGELFAAETKA